jgi:tRNA(Ile)-lysidine synthase
MKADDLPAHINTQLADTRGRLVLGLSGGLDSSVLLEALCRAGLGGRLLAVHVHHGLHADADQWLQHCRHQAERCAVAFVAERVTLQPGGNLESRARTARRAALLAHVGADDVLLLAHHLDDQAETVLLRLLRGAGGRGLAAMAKRQLWRGRQIRRPLLDCSRSQLEAAARYWQLGWIDDPSNDQLHFDRNFVRHQVLPVMTQRWPDAAPRISTSAQVLAEQAGLLDELAAADLAACDGDQGSLSLPLWCQLSGPRRRNLLYGWVRRRGMRPPSPDKIARIDTEMVPAAEDRQPEIVWEDGELVRYRQRLWLLDPGQRQPLTDSAVWQPTSQPDLRLGPLHIRLADGEGLAVRDSGQRLVVRAASGGERILLRGHHRQVSELWRSAGIPPWRRQRLPLFFVGDELVAVAAIGVADGWSPAAGEAAFRLLIEDSAL